MRTRDQYGKSKDLQQQGGSGAVGPIGPVGPAGNTAILVTGEIINGGKVVMVSGGLAYKARVDYESEMYKIIGFAVAAAIAGVSLVIATAGLLVQVGWGLTPGAIYYAVSDGGITTTPPTFGVSQVVGTAVDSNTMLIEIKEPVLMDGQLP